MESKEKKVLDLITLGESRVGKTALIKRQSFYTTLGSEFITKEVKVDNVDIKAHIWDTAGQERFRTLTKAFYQQAQGLIIVYDVTNKETYERLSKWIEEIHENTEPKVVKFLVANKVDLVDDRTVSTEEGKSVAAKYRMKYFETSARSNLNVTEMFTALITETYYATKGGKVRDSFRIGSPSQVQAKKGCC